MFKIFIEIATLGAPVIWRAIVARRKRKKAELERKCKDDKAARDNYAKAKDLSMKAARGAEDAAHSQKQQDKLDVLAAKIKAAEGTRKALQSERQNYRSTE